MQTSSTFACFSAFKKNLLLSFCLFFGAILSAQNSSLVFMDGGSLSYTPFAMEGQTNMVNTIPDFSYAGYQGGGVALPTATVQVTVSPSGGDDTPFIQNAINQVEALPLNGNGLRGAVLLTAGCYEIDQLFIEASGVVLRGEGQGIDGTVLNAMLPYQYDVISIQGTGSGIQRDNSSKQEITSPYVAMGSHSFEVADASGYNIGDRIVVVRTPNQFWIDDLGMDEATLCAGDPDCYGWTPSSYTINHERIITGISANTITVDVPIVDVMETQYGGGEIYKATVTGRIEQCGVENLRIVSYFDPGNAEDENHAWIGVHLKRTINSWVKNVTGQYLGFGTVSISSESNFNTIQECAAIDPVSSPSGGRRYSFNISDGMGNLFQRNYTRGGRHDYVTGSRVAGPNVFLDNYAANALNDIGPHHRWATGLLFDNVGGGQSRVRNRGSSGSGHGWAGNATMFWNVHSYQDDIMVDSPKGGRNWGIGCTGLQQNGAGFWEHWNSNVQPRSLYLQQLQDRLGASAVNNITIPEQLTGTIYTLLDNWAGEYDFAIPSTYQKLYVSEDAYVRGGTNENNNYGSDDDLNVKENSGSANNDRMAFLKFNLNALSAPIYNVKLRLYVTQTTTNPTQNNLHLVTDDTWTENGITWANQPSAGTLLATSNVPAAGSWVEYDITSIVNNELNGDKTLSLRLSEATVGNLYKFSAKEEGGTSFDPYLSYELSAQTPPTASCNSTILPVIWQRFEVKKVEKTAQLDWATSLEINHDYFAIEWKIKDGKFSTLDKVDTPTAQQGTTAEYRFTHQNPASGMNYYRIRQVDLDGNFSFSTIKSLDFSANSNRPFFTISPNPANQTTQLHFLENTFNQEIQLFSITGELLQTALKNPEEQTVTLSLEGLTAGVYLVRVGEDIRKIIKKGF